MSKTTPAAKDDQETDDGISFPIAATIAGVAVVTIPATDYAELLSLRSKFGLASVRSAPVPRSPIEADHEISAFLSERFGSKPVIDILRECRQRFGAERTPSRTAAYAYWSRLRRYSHRS